MPTWSEAEMNQANHNQNLNQAENPNFGRRATDAPRGIRIAAVGDLHVHENSHNLYREFFAEVSREADVLLLCGDLTNLGLPKEAENLARDLSAASIPVLGVLGNHDHNSNQAETVKKILAEAGLHFLEEETFELGDIGFAGVKGFAGGFESYMLGAFGEPMIKNFVSEAINEALKLENALKNLDGKKHLVVAMHYSPVAQTVAGEPPQIFPYLGCSRFAETVDRFENVRVVFHGHAHHGSPAGKTFKGIPVFNCALEVVRKTGTGKNYTLFEIK